MASGRPGSKTAAHPGNGLTLSFTAPLWLYPGESGSWHFITLPKAESEHVKWAVPPRRGWGSVRVTATIGATTWATSVFPDSKTGAYLLPVKADVRHKENIVAGRPVAVTIAIAP